MKCSRPTVVAFLPLVLTAATCGPPHARAQEQENPPPAVVSPPAVAAGETTVETLGRWIEQTAAQAAQFAGQDAPQLEAVGNTWRFVAFGRGVLVLSDPVAGRMRMMTPVLDAQGQPVDLHPAVMGRLLNANFDTALDARYAIHAGQLWSVYLHPLPTLTRTDFDSGVVQILTLAQTYGTTYSSSGVRFGDEDHGQPAPPPRPLGEQTI